MNKDYRLLFKAIVGSQSYNLSTPTSDVDIKGVYIQENDDILVNGGYVPHVEVNKDEFYYELRNFLGLLVVGNPTAIELLFTPVDCVLETSPEFEEIKKYRSMFMTQKLYDSFGGYASHQLKKAQGLEKKFNWKASRVEKKDVVDFCKLLGRPIGRVMPLKQYLTQVGVKQEEVALTKIEGFRDSYKLYLPPNPASEGVIYRGVMKEASNEVRTSEVPKIYAEDWIGTVYFNREAYSTHCRDYKSYKQWEENRNENRYRESRQGQKYDGKNIMHTARLILTIENIHKTGIVDLDMTEYRDELLAIKHGKVNLEETFNEWSERAQKISSMKVNSSLPEEVDMNFVRELELNLRKFQDA